MKDHVWPHFQKRRELKIRRAAKYFDGLRGVWKSGLPAQQAFLFQPNEISGREKAFPQSIFALASFSALFVVAHFPRVLIAALYFVRLVRERERLLRRQKKWLNTFFRVSCNISNTRDSVSSEYENTIKRVETMTRSGVFQTKFEVFEQPMKHCLECLIYLLNQNKN